MDNYAFNHVRITIKMSQWIWVLVLLLLAGCADNDTQELTICCAGDSLMRPIPTHLRNLLASKGSLIRIKDWARGGLNSQTYMSFFRKRVNRQKRYAVDVVLLQLGTNDVISLHSGDYSLTQFETNLKRIIEQFKRFPPETEYPVKILVASVPPLYSPEYQKMNRFIQDELNPVIMNFCEREAAYFVDNWKMLHDRPHLYRPDGVHPSSNGERILAQNWIAAMRKAVRSSIF
jgi:lysophospholipase L1-like esterase